MLRRGYGIWAGVLLWAVAAGGAFAQAAPATAKATFAGGCFWCVESDFDKVPGVVATVSGYIGGTAADARYERVSSGRTGHVEAVEITYDPAKVTYQALLDHFWRTVDPLTAGGQFCDRGPQYRTAIFTHGGEQKRLAEASKTAVAALLKQTVHTEIAPAGTFYPAEDYHQDYYVKNPARYKFYRWNCGRDQRVQQVWGAK